MERAGNSALGSSGKAGELRAGLGPGRAPELLLPRFLGIHLLLGGIWEGKIPCQSRKPGNISDSLVLHARTTREFLGCNSWFYRCYRKYSSPHRLSKGSASPAFLKFPVCFAVTLFTPWLQQEFLWNSRLMEFLTARIKIPPLLF